MAAGVLLVPLHLLFRFRFLAAFFRIFEWRRKRKEPDYNTHSLGPRPLSLTLFSWYFGSVFLSPVHIMSSEPRTGSLRTCFYKEILDIIRVCIWESSINKTWPAMKFIRQESNVETRKLLLLLSYGFLCRCSLFCSLFLHRILSMQSIFDVDPMRALMVRHSAQQENRKKNNPMHVHFHSEHR